MTRVGWTIVVLIVVLTGCSDKNSVPSGILGREDMQNVLWDMIQADQYSATYLAKDSGHIDIRLESMRLYDEVFQLHHISREQFSNSYKYYMAHPDLTQTLLDSLQAMGTRMRAENYSRPRPVSPPAVTAAPTPGQAPPISRPLLPAQKMADSLRRKKLAVP